MIKSCNELNAIKRSMKFVKMDLMRLFRDNFGIAEKDEFSASIEYDYKTEETKISNELLERKSKDCIEIELYMCRCRPSKDFTKVKILSIINHFTITAEIIWANKDNEKVTYNLGRFALSPYYNNMSFSKGDINKTIEIENCLNELLNIVKKDSVEKTKCNIDYVTLTSDNNARNYVYGYLYKTQEGGLNRELSEKLDEIIKIAGIDPEKNIRITIMNPFTKSIPVKIMETGYDNNGKFIYSKKEMFFLVVQD